MTKRFLKTLVTVSCLCATVLLSAQSFQDSYEAAMAEMKNIHYAPSEESDIQLRVLNLDGPVKGVWNEETRNFILHRLKQSTYTAELLGRSVMYAPFIEKALRDNEMPAELFYLCLVESQFNTRTVSHAGAAGLWQLMPETARLMGLKVNGYIDERFDPYKSTEAAVKYLKYLHTELKDWGLAIAGYNMGPTRIQSLLKEGKGETYWDLRQYLPKETQNYVPAFIASNYLMQYYPWHNIRPELPNLDLQLTSSLKLTESISFATVSQVTGIPINTIQLLNPAYRKDILPENPDGNYLILPRRVIKKVSEYLQYPAEFRPSLADIPVIEKSEVNPNSFYERIKISIGSNDNLFNLADAFNCSPSNIRFWNSLPSFYVSEGQELRVFQPVAALNMTPQEIVQAAADEARYTREAALRTELMKSYKVEEVVISLPSILEDVKPIQAYAKVENNNDEPPSEAIVIANRDNLAEIIEDFSGQEVISFEKNINTVSEVTAAIAEVKIENTVEKNIDNVVAAVENKETIPATSAIVIEPLKTTETITKNITNSIVSNQVTENASEAINPIINSIAMILPAAIEEPKSESFTAKGVDNQGNISITLSQNANNFNEAVAVQNSTVEIKSAKVVKVEPTIASEPAMIVQSEDKKLEQSKIVSKETMAVVDTFPLKDEFKFRAKEVQEAKPVLTIASMDLDKKASNTVIAEKLKTEKTENYIYHFIRRNETLQEIAEKYQGVCVSDILAVNDFDKKEVLAVGARIRIKLP